MGFLSSDGRYAHCGRPEYAGGLKLDPNGVTYAHRLDGPCKCGRPHGGADGERRAIKPEKPPRVIQGRQYLPEHVLQDGVDYVRAADYPYVDAQGALVYLVRRYEAAAPDGMKRLQRAKTFRPFTHRGDDVWVMALEVEPILFNLSAMVAAALDVVVFVCEGEKAAEAAQEALQAAGAAGVVTTASGGANGARAVDMAPLRGRRVVILPDADRRDPEAPDAETAGEVYVKTFARRAWEAGGGAGGNDGAGGVA